MYLRNVLTLLLAFYLVSCVSNKTDQLEQTLNDFDSSLDSLIIDNISSVSQYVILYPDTIRGNPKKIETQYYLDVSKEENSLVLANCYKSFFKDNKLRKETGFSTLGEPYEALHIYFDSVIDYQSINNLRRANPSIRYHARVQLYDDKGRLVKDLDEHLASFCDKIVRELYVYQYPSDSIVTYRKFYWGEDYQLDSLRAVKIKKYLTSPAKSNLNYVYRYDSLGNWVEKIPKYSNFPDVTIREITYWD